MDYSQYTDSLSEKVSLYPAIFSLDLEKEKLESSDSFCDTDVPYEINAY